LVKVAKRRLADLARTRSLEGCGNLPHDVEDGRAGAPQDGTPIDPEQKRREAFRVIRSLLPRLGQTRAQQVMALFIDAAENNIVDLPDAVVAETLGIDVPTAKKSRQRAFQRLTRIAEEEGLATQILDRIRLTDSSTEDLT
jgi:DNA-directed RNA polymerase specialized sigma24 family protein